MADSVPVKKSPDAAKFARDEKELLLGGKEVGTNAQGLAKSSSQESVPASSGIPTGAGSCGSQAVYPDSSEIHSNFTSRNMTGQGYQGGNSDASTDGIAGYQSGYAEGQTGVGGVHISNREGLQPQQYGTPHAPGQTQ
ncbi:hypothetical protein BV898_00358 [Hypsibius exemplaris]|uniref:Uncharacterized protein n=1 Tax=Hypsibius exemplaris TaxID=2072580 RepID=A0A1W0XFI5_HYPEX|nr:hypothetical protein BV898_00358 [Hypsibius exemplaris]